MSRTIHLTLKVWRQEGAEERGRLETYETRDISTDMSFLEMLDVVNERLTLGGKEPIAFDHDCREGICGMCGTMVNGHAHGGHKGTTLCQVHMRLFQDGSHIYIEPWRAKAFPIIRDLMVDRGAFDSIQQAGGYVAVNTGAAPEAASLPVPKKKAEAAMDAAACIGCGACVAACKNASAALFVGAKISHLALLPQGHPERGSRVRAMVQLMDNLGFGNCSNEAECEAVCPKEISIANIARLRQEYLRSLVVG